MLRIKVLRNLGAGLPRYRAGEVVNVTNEEADSLVRLGLAEVIAEDIKGIPKPAAIRGIPPRGRAEADKPDDDSPLVNENADVAIDHIKRMRSTEKLHEIVSNDTRSTVVEAASKRLSELEPTN